MYDATVDGADSQQPEDQHYRDSHPDATPMHSARVYSGIVRGCGFSRIEKRNAKFLTGAALLSRESVDSDGYDGARIQKARPPTGARIRTVRDFIRRPRVRLYERDFVRTT